MDLHQLLDEKLRLYHTKDFIPLDPVSIPHLFSQKEDIEISGLIAALFSWGQRATIIAKSKDFLQRMDNAPFQFVMHHADSDLKNLLGFKHRTFTEADALFLVAGLKEMYSRKGGMEALFTVPASHESVESGINRFYDFWMQLPYALPRFKKHLASPARKSACKRINMFLRWMVRKDEIGVDFGLWSSIRPHQLVCPCDVHVERIGRQLGLIQSPRLNWNTALELTRNLKKFDPQDPVKYDYALFMMGIVQNY